MNESKQLPHSRWHLLSRHLTNQTKRLFIEVDNWMLKNKNTHPTTRRLQCRHHLTHPWHTSRTTWWSTKWFTCSLLWTAMTRVCRLLRMPIAVIALYASSLDASSRDTSKSWINVWHCSRQKWRHSKYMLSVKYEHEQTEKANKSCWGSNLDALHWCKQLHQLKTQCKFPSWDQTVIGCLGTSNDVAHQSNISWFISNLYPSLPLNEHSQCSVTPILIPYVTQWAAETKNSWIHSVLQRSATSTCSDHIGRHCRLSLQLESKHTVRVEEALIVCHPCHVEAIRFLHYWAKQR